MFGSGATILIISSKETNDILKIVESFEEPGLLIKGVKQTIKNSKRTRRRIYRNVIRHFNTIQDGQGGGAKSLPVPVFPL